MSTVNSDFEKFNQYVKVHVGSLKARGQRTDNLMINLFKAYYLASDCEFLRWVKTNLDQYEDVYNISIDELMTSTLNKFEILRKVKRWNSMYPEQEQIIVLDSAVEKLKDDNLKLSKNSNTLPPVKLNGKGRVKYKGRVQKQAGKQSQYYKVKEELNKKEPKHGESNTKKVNDKTYFWCPNYHDWTIHCP